MLYIDTTKEILYRKLALYERRTIDCNTLRSMFSDTDYLEFQKVVIQLMNEGALEAIAADKGKTNGRIPPLPYRFRINIRTPKINREDEIKSLYPLFGIKRYLENPSRYEKDRDIVLPISKFLYESYGELSEKIECNERSLQIWGDEKYLHARRKRVKRILAENGIDEDILNFYTTAYPFAYFIAAGEEGKSSLIVENLATYGSLERLHKIEGIALPYQTVIFGSGGHLTSEQIMDEFLEGVYETTGIRITRCEYLGDLDREGIFIMNSVMEKNKTEIVPAERLYGEMIRRGRNRAYKPHKDQTKRPDISALNLSAEDEKFLEDLLYTKKQVIPQEILNKTVLREIFTGEDE